MPPQPAPALNVPALLLTMGLISSVVGAWIWVVLRLAFGKPVLPPSTPRVVPWGPGSVLLAMLTWVAAMIAAPLAYRVAFPGHFAGRAGGAMPDPGLLMSLSAAQNLATLILVPAILAITAGARRRDYGVGWSGLGWQAVRGIVAYPILAPLVFGVMLASIKVFGRTTHPLEEAIQGDRTPGMAAILILAGVVLAPAAEELIFRGVLLGWLTRVALGVKGLATARPPADDEIRYISTFEPIASPAVGSESSPIAGEVLPINPYSPPTAPTGPPPPAFEIVYEDGTAAGTPAGRALPMLLANVAVSLIFAAMHGAVWPTPIPIFFLSMGLGVLYQRTGGIIAPVALHVTFNGISTLLMFLAVGADPPQGPRPADPNPGPAWSAPAGSPRIFPDSGPLTVPGRSGIFLFPLLRMTRGPRMGRTSDLPLDLRPAPVGKLLARAAATSDIRGTIPGASRTHVRLGRPGPVVHRRSTSAEYREKRPAPASYRRGPSRHRRQEGAWGPRGTRVPLGTMD